MKFKPPFTIGQHVEADGDLFRGDNDHLVSCINALLELDAENALVPHGIGGHARKLLEAAAIQLAATTPVPEAGFGSMREAVAWLPIETAPKDGTALLVMRDIWPGTSSGHAEECNDYNTYVASWWGSEGVDGKGRWVCYMDSVLDPTCPIEPTHYMPLPPPPSATPPAPDHTEQSLEVVEAQESASAMLQK